MISIHISVLVLAWNIHTAKKHIHPPKSAVAAREIKMFFMMAINFIVVLIGLKGMNSTLALAVGLFLQQERV